MNSISSSLSGSASLRQSMFSRIDKNTDGLVSKDEFVSGRPGDVSESLAASLFGKLDTNGTGSITEGQLTEGMAANKPASGDSSSLSGNLSSEVLAAILQLVQQVQGGKAPPPSATDMFSQMDTDSSGDVNKAEFLAAKPKDVSDDQALALFNSIDTDKTGSISLAQFEDSMKAGPAGQQHASGAGAPPPPPPPGGGGSSAEEAFDPLDTNQDGTVSFQELMAGLADQEDKSASNGPLQSFLKAVQAYAATDINTNATSSLLG